MEKATKYFRIEELIPETWPEYAKQYNPLWLFDKRILDTADMLRERYGTAYINNWYWGGSNTLSGWRPFNVAIGAKWSQHKFGRAIDIKFKDVTAEEVRKEMRRFGRQVHTFKHITTTENTVPWLHVDCRTHKYTEGYDIYFFNP